MAQFDDDSDLALSIPLKSIYEEFSCPICFNPITACVMTPCGHNFCEECIMECINRKHVCPCCNRDVVKTQLVKNHHIDKLLALINQEKDEASKRYFSSLINQGSASVIDSAESSPSVSSSIPSESEGGSGMSPIEKLFHQHLKRSLLAYKEYYKDVKKKYKKTEEQIREECIAACQQVEKTVDIRKSGGAERDRQIAGLRQECDQRLARLGESFRRAVDDLLASYDRYLSESIPAPSFLPVQVVVVLPAHSIRLEKITIRPTDGVRQLRATVEHRLQELGNPVTSFSSSAVFTLTSPLQPDEQIVLSDLDRPIIQYKQVVPGSEIIVQSGIILESDKPKSCFTATFQKGGNQVCDYYTCKDCKYNWVCQTCATECHKGHQLVIYIANHKPTWACCYCMKNRNCKLPNAKTKGT